MPACLRGDWTSPEPSMSPPPSASSPRAPRVDGRARENRHECIIGTHARARSTSRRIASTEACARFFVSPDRVSARARERSIERARARIRRISTADRSGGRSARRETVSSRDERARRWNSRAEVLSIVSSTFRARTEVARARSSIRFDSIRLIRDRKGFHFILSGEVR